MQYNVPFPYKREVFPEREGEHYSYSCISCNAPMHVAHQDDCPFAGYRGEKASYIVIDEMVWMEEGR